VSVEVFIPDNIVVL